MDNNQLNYEQLHLFFKGYQSDMDDHAESQEESQSYNKARNLRLFSENGILSLESITGTKKVYENNNIIKYLGWYAFADELILFTKTNLSPENPNIVDQVIKGVIIQSYDAESFSDTINFGFAPKMTYYQTTIPAYVDVEDEDSFNQKLSCISNGNIQEGDYVGLFDSVPITPEKLCPLYNGAIPPNNEEYADAIWSLKFNNSGGMDAVLIYLGYLNFPMNGKITTAGVYENEFYKRVYFSDYVNPTRVINLKDKKLLVRLPEELSISLSGRLLNPRLKEITDNGSVKAMSVMYMYRLISENGQTSDYSPSSDSIKVLRDYVDGEMSGGNVGEITNKAITIYAIIPDYRFYKEIEMVAVEFEADMVPSGIKLIGRKPVDFYVEFTHTGNESDYQSNITLSDLFANSANFKYNSDFSTKNNKLIVAGLRNDPLILDDNNVVLDFGLTSFDFNGNTFDCILNPEPEKYFYIDKDRTTPNRYVHRKLFTDIKIFESTKVILENSSTGEKYETIITSNQNRYTDVMDEVFEFLEVCMEDEDFDTNFPNLVIEKNSSGIVFKRDDENIYTDFYNYILVFTSTQVIVNQQNDVRKIPTSEQTESWPSTNQAKEQRLVYGAVSDGWFRGNGVRVTMRSFYDSVAEMHTDWFNGSSPVVKIKTPEQEPYVTAPTQRKGVMKGEIYRIGIQWFKDGKRLFTTVLGDIKVPEINWATREVDEDNNIIPHTTLPEQVGNGFVFPNYRNSLVDTKNITLLACRVELQFDVRISCEMSKHVDSYQIVYVERTENNRSILAQGITGPFERMIPFNYTKEVFVNKWQLPIQGGPMWDSLGLQNFDDLPNNTDVGHWGYLYDIDYGSVGGGTAVFRGRITTHRKLFWLDSPDIIFDKVSANNIENYSVEFLSAMRPDHADNNILSPFNSDSSIRPPIIPFGQDGIPYDVHEDPDVSVPFGSPKFSQKISNSYIAGEPDDNPGFVNVSMFVYNNKAKTAYNWVTNTNYLNLESIDKSYDATPGRILSGFQMGEVFEVSNKAMTMPNPIYHFDFLVRDGARAGYRTVNAANGRRTVILKTEGNFYRNDHIPQTPFRPPYIPLGGLVSGYQLSYIHGHTIHIIANLRIKNLSSIYGGRTDFAYRNSQFIPMSDVIPVVKEMTVSQIFKVQGDTYTSLYLRNKTSFDGAFDVEDVHSSWYGGENGEFKARTNRGAWCYGVVLESTIEPKFNNGNEFYKSLEGIGFSYDEQYNSAYRQENDLRRSIPVPYNFKDDPDQSNIVAASDVKLKGDYYDAWTRFRTNEFYELDKDKGAVLNLAKQEDEIFAIQEQQTSILQIDDRAIISSESGMPVNISQGAGNSFLGHKIISNYGTSFRRAVIESEFGFVFFDENKKEFVKIKEPLFLVNNLSLKYNTYFSQHRVVDAEGYFDDKYKETNVRIRTANEDNFVISYNEVLKVFNGEIEYNNDLYAVFQNKIVVPYDGKKLAVLNEGNELNFFESQKDFHVGLVSGINYPSTKIFKGVGLVLNTNYPIESANFVTSLGGNRTILGTHHWYKIREGVHTFPTKNASDANDIRGEWVEITLRIKSINNKKIRLFSLINYLRNSYK